jgi:hypothetical protein
LQEVGILARAVGGMEALGAVDLPLELVQAIEEAARRAGLSVAAWCQRAYAEQLQREEAP